jgi:hypothetical protein
MDHHQSILPTFDVFQPGPPVRHPPPGGQMLGAAPRRAARFVASPAAAMLSGFGQEAPPIPQPTMPVVESAMPMGIALVVLGVVGYLSYEVGSAMAPSGGKRSTWGLIGIPVGLFTGPIGLGVMAIVSNHTSIGRRG